MKAELYIDRQTYAIDFSKPLDISIPLTNNGDNPIAWYLEQPQIEPVRVGDWVGKVSEGQSATNFNTIVFNPHAHGTHTECLGHITRDFYSVNQSLKQFVFLAQVMSVTPVVVAEDQVITLQQIQSKWIDQNQKAVVIRTLPNVISKRNKNYSHTNPPYLDHEAVVFLRESGVEHLLIDLPSVDKEKDDGKLLAHKAFWNVTNTDQLNEGARLGATITEMIFVCSEILDGFYLLNLQVAPFENDAAPSKPVLYEIQKPEKG